MSVSAIEQRTPASAHEDAFRDLLACAHRRRWIIAFAFVLTTGVATALSLTAPPVYEASSAVTADKSPPVVMMSNPGQESSLLQQQVSQAPDALTLTEMVKSDAVRDATEARLLPVVPSAQAKAALSHLRVQQVRSTDIVRITVTYGDPTVAAAVANAVVQSVIHLDLDARRRVASQARLFIGQQLEIARQQLQTSENRLTAYKNRYRDVSLKEETVLNLRRLADLQDKLADVRLQAQEAQGGSGRSASLDPQTRGTFVESTPNSVITTLQGQLAALEIELSGLRKQFTPLHPAVISAGAKIEETKRRLSAAIAQNQAALAAREQGLAADISRVEQALMQVPNREAELTRLTRDVGEAERTYMILSEKLQEALIAEGSIGSAVRVVDVAQAPEKPVGPKRTTSAGLGAVLGLMLGLAGAYVMEQLDDTVKSSTDVERLLGAPVLGTVPVLRSGDVKNSPGRKSAAPLAVMQLDQSSSAAEAFRVVRTHILTAMAKAQYKCLLIASAHPLEGKSTIAVNLAIAVAQTERRVLLMDCDLRRSTLSRLLAEADSPGLSTLLAGEADVGDVVRSTEYRHITCVVSGPAVPNPAELLQTERMREFMIQVRDRADLILLDTPAILPVVDAEVAGLQADGAVVVVRVGKTDRRALAEIRHRLDCAGVHVIGSVLNYVTIGHSYGN